MDGLSERSILRIIPALLALPYALPWTAFSPID